MTRPSAPAVITTAGLLTWAAAAFGYAAVSGNWGVGVTVGGLAVAGVPVALTLLWHVTDPGHQDGNDLEAIANATRERLPRRWTPDDWNDLERELNR